MGVRSAGGEAMDKSVNRVMTQLVAAALLAAAPQVYAVVDATHDAHMHGMASGVISGLPHGMPRLCAAANIRAVRDGIQPRG